MDNIVVGFTSRPGMFYRKAFERAGKELGLEVKLTDLSEEDRIRWEKLDALVLPGGPDINPQYYLNGCDESLREHTKKNRELVNQNKKSRKRDAFEHGVLMELFHNRALFHLPVLGICRGMQMLAVAQGIPLYLDLRLETGLISTRFEYIPVDIVPGSSLHHIVSEDHFRAFKNQHQAIRLPYLESHREKWPHINVSALSHNGQMVEAIEFRDRPVIGVQFHPELTLDVAPRKLFSWVVKEAQRRSDERKLILEQEHFV